MCSAVNVRQVSYAFDLYISYPMFPFAGGTSLYVLRVHTNVLFVRASREWYLLC